MKEFRVIWLENISVQDLPPYFVKGDRGNTNVWDSNYGNDKDDGFISSVAQIEDGDIIFYPIYHKDWAGTYNRHENCKLCVLETSTWKNGAIVNTSVDKKGKKSITLIVK